MTSLAETIIASVISAAVGAGGTGWYLAIKGGPQRKASVTETLIKLMEDMLATQKLQFEKQLEVEKANNEQLRKDKSTLEDEVKKLTVRVHAVEMDAHTLRLENLAAKNGIKIK